VCKQLAQGCYPIVVSYFGTYFGSLLYILYCIVLYALLRPVFNTVLGLPYVQFSVWLYLLSLAHLITNFMCYANQMMMMTKMQASIFYFSRCIRVYLFSSSTSNGIEIQRRVVNYAAVIFAAAAAAAADDVRCGV